MFSTSWPKRFESVIEQIVSAYLFSQPIDIWYDVGTSIDEIETTIKSLELKYTFHIQDKYMFERPPGCEADLEGHEHSVGKLGLGSHFEIPDSNPSLDEAQTLLQLHFLRIQDELILRHPLDILGVNGLYIIWLLISYPSCSGALDRSLRKNILNSRDDIIQAGSITIYQEIS